LQLGADDYLPKPFAMQELIARVRALGRRFAEEPPLNLRVGDLTFDLANHEVFSRRSTNRVVGTRTNVVKGPLCASRAASSPAQNYASACGNTPTNTTPSWLRFSSGRLRKKIGDPPLIHTVRHVGYTICDPITLSATPHR